MNSRSLRRLAGDHAALHNTALPPNYLFGPSSNDSDLTCLDILLAGPTSTPYESGVFKLHLTIPTTYPNEPPKAFFRTKIFHPNVDDSTGAVCVETLKRDWDPKLSLKHVLVTISCLLVQPNASSALNADAGMLLEQGDGGWDAFEKRARLMTRLHAAVPRDLKGAVRAAQRRGDEREDLDPKDSGAEVDAGNVGKRKRRGTPFDTAVDMNKRRAETPPLPSAPRPAPSRPFVVQSAVEDVFGGIRLPAPTTRPTPEVDPDSGLLLQDRENDSSVPPVSSRPPVFPSLARQGPPIPLGDLSISDSSLEEEYPPSPKKSPQKQTRNPSLEYPASPRKSPQKRLDFGIAPTQQARPNFARGESSRTAAERRLFFTTPLTQQERHQQQQTPPLNYANDSSLVDSFNRDMDTEPDTEVDMSFEMPKRKTTRRLASTVRSQRRQHFEGCGNVPAVPKLAARSNRILLPVETPVLRPLSPATTPEDTSFASINPHGLKETRSNQVAKSEQQLRNEEMEKKLWRLCGGDIERWNKGDFGTFFEVRAARW